MARKKNGRPTLPHEEDLEMANISMVLMLIYTGETTYVLQQAKEELHALENQQEPIPQPDASSAIEIQCYLRFRQGILNGKAIEEIIEEMMLEGLLHKYSSARQQQENHRG